MEKKSGNQYLLKCLDKDAFEKNKRNSYPIYVAGNRLLTTAMTYLPDEETGIAIFSNEGCLVRLYGNNKFLEWADKMGIVPGTDWREQFIGTTAVSMGLRYESPFMTSGKQHLCKQLQNVTIAFSPCRVERPLQNGKYLHRAHGIGILGSLNHSTAVNWLSLAYALSESVSLRGFFTTANPIIGYQKFWQQGILGIDFENGNKRIISVDANMCQFWNMTKEELFYRDLGSIVTRCSDNRDFWEIVDKRKEVVDYPVVVKVEKDKKKYFITSRSYTEDIMDFRGILLNLRPIVGAVTAKKKGESFTAETTFESIVGDSILTKRTKEYARKAAKSEANVLILGESGSGKDLYAQAIHNGSKRCNGPYVALNCAAFPKELFSSELFGYEDGAFTGGRKGGNIGKFELADGGTLFLDEIGDMPLESQAILLRAIEQKSFMRLGSSVQKKSNVRIIAATNANLDEKIRRGEFREDLYYRLSVMCIWIPPLRDRKEDIRPLADYFVRNYTNDMGKQGMILSNETYAYLKRLNWKGNVRELKHMIESIVCFYESDTIYPEHVMEILNMRNDLFYSDSKPNEIGLTEILNEDMGSARVNERITPEILRRSLRNNRYNKSKTALELGISRKKLYALLSKYEIEY